MNRLFFIFCLSFLSSNLLAQKFSLLELVKLYDSNNDYFDTYVLQKGYNFSSSKQNKISYSYSDKSLFNSINVIYTKDQSDTSKIYRGILWIFVSDTTYLSFKKDLSDLGYLMYNENYSGDESNSYHHFFYTNRDQHKKKIYNVELIVGKRSIYKTPIYYVNIFQ